MITVSHGLHGSDSAAVLGSQGSSGLTREKLVSPVWWVSRSRPMRDPDSHRAPDHSTAFPSSYDSTVNVKGTREGESFGPEVLGSKPRRHLIRYYSPVHYSVGGDAVGPRTAPLGRPESGSELC